MAEPFTDAELDAGVHANWDPIGAVPSVLTTVYRLAATVWRLRRERDEARKLAAALGDYYLSGSTGFDGLESYDAANKAVEWHPAYAKAEAER